MTAKIPTPQAISRLLSGTGFTRAVIAVEGGTSGYQVTACSARADAVKVRQYFILGNMPPQRYRAQLRRYATAIEAAGYSADVYTYHLIVTAPKTEAGK